MQEWTFVFASDIHVGTPRSFRFRPAINDQWSTARRQILNLDPDLLLLGGDMTRDGATHRFELEQVRDECERFPFPWRAIPGNHDVGNKRHPDADLPVCREFLRLYRSVFGPDFWSCRYRNVQFTGINAFLPGSGLPDETAMWAWLESLDRQPDVDHHVWLLHLPLFLNDPSEATVDFHADRKAWYRTLDLPGRERVLASLRRTRADLVLTGHLHCRREMRGEGIRLQAAPATAWGSRIEAWPDGDSTPGFLRGSVRRDRIDIEFIALAECSERTGYGPSGNPPLSIRDYSAALESPALDPVEQALPAADAIAVGDPSVYF